MTLFLDSALADDARRAGALGFVGGVTTNPTLMAKAARPAEDVIRELCALCPGIIFYQLAAPTLAERETEAHRMANLNPGRVGIKIPCTLENLALAARLSKAGYVVGITAIFSAAQAHLACQAGARYVLPYVNRSTRLLGDGLALVREMRAVIDANRSATEIIAASLKSTDEAVQTVLAGAHHLTLPLAIIEAMGQHPLSEQAIEEFARAQA
jgi:transaldolase